MATCSCFPSRRLYNDRAREEFRRNMLERQRTWTPSLAGGPLITFSRPPYDPGQAFDEFGQSRLGANKGPEDGPSAAILSAERYEKQRNNDQLTTQWRQWLAQGRKQRQGPKSLKHLKRLLRQGVPNEYRAEVWSAVLGSDEDVSGRHSATEYTKLVASLSVDAVTLHQIDLDVGRTFPSNVLFRTSDGGARLQRVLRAFAAFKASVSYCQSMNFVAGLLLIFMDEELAFWTMTRLICGPREGRGRGLGIADYYESGMRGLRRDTAALQLLMRDWTPLSLARLEANHVELSWICSEWFLCLFVTTLPLRTVLRIWDSLMFEGTKVLFRVGLALLREFHTIAGKDEVFLEWIMQHFKQDLAEIAYDHEMLMRGAFRGFRGFSHKDITRARHQAALIVQHEDRDRERLREERSQAEAELERIPAGATAAAAPPERLASEQAPLIHQPSVHKGDTVVQCEEDEEVSEGVAHIPSNRSCSQAEGLRRCSSPQSMLHDGPEEAPLSTPSEHVDECPRYTYSKRDSSQSSSVKRQTPDKTTYPPVNRTPSNSVDSREKRQCENGDVLPLVSLDALFPSN